MFASNSMDNKRSIITWQNPPVWLPPLYMHVAFEPIMVRKIH